MTIILNGDPVEVGGPLTLSALLLQLGVDSRRVAVEHNLNVIKRPNYDTTQIQEGDQVEIVNFVGGGIKSEIMTEPLVIADREFKSRLIVGTGKYSSFAVMQRAHEASGADMVTVAVRRVDLKARGPENLLDHIDTKRIFILPNTAGCYNAEEAVRTARLGREAGLSHWVKLEVIGDEKTLFPDTEGLLAATRILVKEGFIVLPYTSDDVVVAKKLEDAGAAAVMPLGAPIGSGLGIQNRINIQLVREAVKVPVIVDAGVGTASDATIAMELGADGVLMNTAIALAAQPVRMARAMRLAVESGREAFLSGRMARKMYASASSPIDGLIGR